MPPRDPSSGGAVIAGDSPSNSDTEHDAVRSKSGAIVGGDEIATGEINKGSCGGRGASSEKIATASKYCSFHWELNVYTAAALSLAYNYLIPEEYRFVFVAMMSLIAVDAARYYYNKGTMTGNPYTFPFVSLVAMVVSPVRFWAEQAQLSLSSPDGMSTNTLLGKFMVFVTDPIACRTVFTGEGIYGMYAHPNAMWLFGRQNLIYVTFEPHKKIRAILTPALFSHEALLQYTRPQELVVRKYLSLYSSLSSGTDGRKPFDARVVFRTMAAASSQEAFLGPYLTPEIKEQLENDIVTFTMGFLSFPFPYLNSGLHRAIQAKNRIESIVLSMVPKAREYVRGGKNEPRCLLERWSVAIFEAAEEQGCEPQLVNGCDDDNVARTVLDFLFAAQDATNSALAYSLDVLDEHRDILEKMRREVDQVGYDSNKECRFNWKDIRDNHQLSYVAKVSNQMLHHKPPVPMVPHLTKKTTELNGRTIPAGSVVIPSITYSARALGSSKEFLPDRPDDDALFTKTLTFGAGQHKCPGRRYAESFLNVFLTVLAKEYDFGRTGARPHADDFMYYPTIFPSDCEFYLFPVDGTKKSSD